MMNENLTRCEWCVNDELMMKYHDEEFGTPTHDDYKQFEYLMLECLQCGLNWQYVVRRRHIFKSCFDNFDFEKVALYDEQDISRILQTKGMLKSRRKIEAIINNSKRFIEIRREFGSFSNYIWSYVDNVPITYKSHINGDIPAENDLSRRIAKDLKSRGFKYIGAVTIYSHLQGVGIINDHVANCFRYSELVKNTLVL